MKPKVSLKNMKSQQFSRQIRVLKWNYFLCFMLFNGVFFAASFGFKMADVEKKDLIDAYRASKLIDFYLIWWHYFVRLWNLELFSPKRSKFWVLFVYSIFCSLKSLLFTKFSLYIVCNFWVENLMLLTSRWFNKFFRH